MLDPLPSYFSECLHNQEISRQFDASIPYTVERVYTGYPDEIMQATDTVILTGDIVMEGMDVRSEREGAIAFWCCNTCFVALAMYNCHTVHFHTVIRVFYYALNNVTKILIVACTFIVINSSAYTIPVLA